MKPAFQVDQIWSSDLPYRPALAREQIGGYARGPIQQFERRAGSAGGNDGQ